MRTQVWACGLMMAMAVGGCTGVSDADMERLDVRVNIEPATFVPGTLAAIDVTVTNNTDDDIALQTTGCIVTFQLQNAFHEVVAPKQPICPLILLAPVVVAGSSFTITFDWRGGEDSGDSALLPPGDYELVGILDGIERPLVSAPVTVQLLGVQ